MQAQLKRIGNSKGLTLSASLLERLGWTESTALDLKEVGGSLVITKATPSLDELLATVPVDYKATEEEWGVAVGKEGED